MATEKVSLTIDEELLTEAREAVGARGLSGYVNRALRQQLQHDRIAGLLAELERQHGPIDPEVMEEVRRAWPLPGEKTSKRRHRA
jgi:Arc/MetJ family transcription regulator